MAEMWGIPMFTHSGGQKHAAVWASDSCRKEYISAVHLQALTYLLGMNTEWIYTHCYIYTLIIGDRQQCYRYLKEKTFCQWSLWVPQESTLTFDSLVIHFSNFFVLCHQGVKDESVFMSVTFAPFLIFRLRRHLHQLLEQTEYRASNNQFYVVKKNNTNDLQVYICPIYQNRRQSCHKGSDVSNTSIKPNTGGPGTQFLQLHCTFHSFTVYCNNTSKSHQPLNNHWGIHVFPSCPLVANQLSTGFQVCATGR